MLRLFSRLGKQAMRMNAGSTAMIRDGERLGFVKMAGRCLITANPAPASQDCLLQLILLQRASHPLLKCMGNTGTSTAGRGEEEQ